jgi:diacylglycerol kinase (ATP)
MPDTLVIYNPIAGRGRVHDQWAQVEAALHAAGVDFDSVASRAPLDAIRLAREAPQKYARVIGVGGDGTLHEVVNGLMQASGEAETITLGIIPMGNGDDFAKVIPPEAPVGGKPFDWRVAVEKFARGETQLFDVGRMLGDHLRPDIGDGPHYFINGMDVGFGAHTARNFTTIPKFVKGLSAYVAAILKTLIQYPVVRLRMQLDDQPPFEQATTMTAITNGRCFGNGFWVCPEASAQDSLFDLMVAEAINRRTILRLVPKLAKGAHTHEPEIKMYRARRVVLDSQEPLLVEADGELPYLETHHLELEILPGRLRLVV